MVESNTRTNNIFGFMYELKYWNIEEDMVELRG
jgi:hypothetical protein